VPTENWAFDNTPPTIDELLQRVEELAPLPHVASRVIQVTEEDTFSAYDLAAIIATDTALTAKMLRVTNSAFYAYPRRITTVRDSVVLIGFRVVRATAIAAAIIDLFPGADDGPFNSDLFWGHAVACGVVAEAIARETGHARPDEAFTVGILHDLGRLVLSQYEPERFGRVLSRAIDGTEPMEIAERLEFGYDHAELGAALTSQWNFPSKICTAIAEHHNLEQAPDRSGLTYVLAQANALCHKHGLWCGLDTLDGAKAYGPPGSITDDSVFAEVIHRIGGLSQIHAKVSEFVRSSQDREISWYSDVAIPTSPPADGEDAA
jgi:putative nucleotidyltransferase with HDIG domain